MGDHDLPPESEHQDQNFDAPTGPPGFKIQRVSEAYLPVQKFFEEILYGESLLLDLSFERSMKIVELNLAANRAGIDNFIESGVSPVLATAQLAAPLAVELYKQALASINQPENAARLKELVDAAKAKKASLIAVP